MEINLETLQTKKESEKDGSKNKNMNRSKLTESRTNIYELKEYRIFIIFYLINKQNFKSFLEKFCRLVSLRLITAGTPKITQLLIVHLIALTIQ